MFAQRYLHVTGATTEAFGQVAVADRTHAATNPAAWFYGKPITLEDHQSSRWIVEPLRLLDCCQETDGGQAIVVTSFERARDRAPAPAVIKAAAQGSGDQQDMMTSYYRDDMTGLPEMGVVARQLWETSGLGPDDIQTRRALRPLHPVRALPVRGARLLRVGRGQGLRARRPHRDGRQLSRSTPTAASSARHTCTG